MTMQFCERLRALRLERGWSCVELAQRSGISRSYLVALESAGSAPTLRVIEKLAAAFEMSPLSFLAPLYGTYPHPRYPFILSRLRADLAEVERLVGLCAETEMIREQGEGSQVRRTG